MKLSILKNAARAATLFAGVLAAPIAQASITTFTGSYTNNFDSIGTSGTTLPTGFTSMVIAGGNSTYTAASPITAAGIASATADTQTLTIWNVGTAAQSSGSTTFNIGGWDRLNDRSLGTDPTGTGAQVIQLAMTNNTGSTLRGVTFYYDCKCLTNGSAGTEQSELPGYCFFYSTTLTNSAAAWSEVGVAGTGALVGGIPTQNGLCLPNYTQGTTMSSGPVNITFATPLTNNGVMYFRWADDNNVASSPDQQISIDNVGIQIYTPAGPVVSITSPVSGSTIGTGPVSIQAATSDLTGSVTNVNFYSGTTLLGNVTTSPFNFTWANVTAGTYSLTAQAIDNGGLLATSSVVSLSVTNPLVASFTGSYTENFDLDLTNSSTTVPAGFTAMIISGSHFTYTNAPGSLLDSNAIATATVGSSASTLIAWNAGAAVTDSGSQLFNIGCWDSLNDRALGTDPSGTAASVIQLALTNNTGSPLNGVTFSYTEKCLTNGATSNGSFTDDGTERLELPGYEFFYSTIGGSQATNWYASAALSMTNWTQGTTTNTGPVTLLFPAPLPANGVMYFRWADDNCVASSPDQMYAIDDVNVSTFNPTGPIVSLTTPTNNQNFPPGTTIPISAIATDFTTNITNVTFYADGSALPFTVSSNASTYSTSIPGVYVGNPGVIPIGTYTVTAVAEDASGLFATSAVTTVTIMYVPPTVSLISPTNGNSFAAPASILLSASAASADGTVTNVAFYQGSTLIANVGSAPFTNTVANVFAGSYNFTVQATDSHGLTATSSVVSVTVTNGSGTPLVGLTAPTNNANFLPGSNITITANAVESGGTLTNVEFFANSTDLGGATTSLYSLTWSNVTVGAYALTAVASDLAGNFTTSTVVNVTVSVPNVPPTISLTSPTNNAAYNAPASVLLSATAADSDGTVTNVAFYQGTTLIANVASAPYNFTWTGVASGSYTLSAVATDNSGASTTSGSVNITVANLSALATIQQIKTVFIIPLENHDFVQANPTGGSAQQLLNNPACPYFNSLITPGNSNAVQTAYATHYFSCAINGEHPSEPNYIWSEAGTDFGIRTDNDPNSPTTSHNVYTNVQHLTGQLTVAGIPWRSYQEDLEYTASEEVTVSGSGAVNPYNGTTQYNYAVKHNPMAFFNDTQNKFCFPLTNFWTDLTNNNIGRYNWITPDQFNEMHSSLSGGYTYHGTAYTGDQAAIASGDNALSILIPKIMASQAYKDHGVIIIWTDETESTDDTNTTLPYVIISPLAKGNAYASTLPYSHSSDLKTMDELFGLAYQTNAIPAGETDAQNDDKFNYVDGRSASINDLSDFFKSGPVAGSVQYTRTANSPLLINISNLLTNVTDAAGFPISLIGVGTDGLNLLTTNGSTLATNSSFILYTNSVTPNVNDSFEYTVTDGHGGTNTGTVTIIVSTNSVIGQTSPQLVLSSTNVTVTFFGVPGYQYVADRSTNLNAGSGWVPISTNTAPIAGMFQVIDSFTDLGLQVPPLPPTVFYRLRYNP